MHYVALTFFVIVAVLFIAGNLKIVFLLTQLGFSFEVMKFFLFELIVLTISIFVLHSSNYSNFGFVISGLLIGMVVPTIFLSTKKEVNPTYRNTKPKYMSQQKWNWRHYKIGRSEPYDGGFGSW